MDYISYGYAFLIAAGGVYGYVKAGSVASLLSGLVFGALSGCGAYLNSYPRSDFKLSFGTSLVLGLIMTYRAFKSGKFMPAGIVATLSAIMVVRFLPKLFN